MQWLRGCVSADAVREEFASLKSHNTAMNSCELCAEPLMECQHLRAPTFSDNLKELKRKRVIKPCILIIILGLMTATSAVTASSPYIIQVIKAHGIPLDANLTASILSSTGLIGTFGFMFCVKVFGKRRLYLLSGTAIVLCCIGLSKVLLREKWT